MKILDSEFRKELYKSLTDAGYDKSEAQQIVGVKYFQALKDDVAKKLTNICEEIVNNSFDVSFDDISQKIAELKKLKELLG